MAYFIRFKGAWGTTKAFIALAFKKSFSFHFHIYLPTWSPSIVMVGGEYPISIIIHTSWPIFGAHRLMSTLQEAVLQVPPIPIPLKVLDLAMDSTAILHQLVDLTTSLIQQQVSPLSYQQETLPLSNKNTPRQSPCLALTVNLENEYENTRNEFVIHSV